MNIAGVILLFLGAAVLLLASIGLFTLRDALSRQHAATKAGSLGIAGIVLGAARARHGATFARFFRLIEALASRRIFLHAFGSRTRVGGEADGACVGFSARRWQCNTT